MNWETFHDVFSSIQLKIFFFSIKDLREYTLKPGAWFVLQGGGARILDLMLPFQFTFYFVVCSGGFASWVSSTNWCSPRKLSASFRQGITSLCSEGRLWESCCPRPGRLPGTLGMESTICTKGNTTPSARRAAKGRCLRAAKTSREVWPLGGISRAF